MSRSIKESDWKHFREVRKAALERYCAVTLEQLAEISSDSNGEHHARYLEAYDYLMKRNKEVARAFDDFRRSTALSQIILLNNMGLIEENEMLGFSEEIVATVSALGSNFD